MRKRKGFTLVEILVVVAIVAVLAAIALPVFSRYRQSAYRNAVRSDLRNAVAAILAFSERFDAFPRRFVGGRRCGPGPAVCGLRGRRGEVMENAVSVSRGVILRYRRITCPDGSKGFELRGEHTGIRRRNWQARYNSCTGEYTGF